MTRLLLTTSIILGMAAPAMAAPSLPDQAGTPAAYTEVATQSATDFIRKMSDSAIGFLGNEGMSQTQKEAEFKKLLQKSFDMKTIGRFSVGTYWNTMTPAQRNEYQALFEKMIVKVYSARFSEYNGQKLDVGTARAEGKDQVVTSYIVPKSGSKIRVDWRVRNKDGQNKIVDVIIEGVSMAMTQRSDFSSVIQRGGGDAKVLIDHLKK